MSETETQTVSATTSPAVVKEAEVKLKEMSRKAKERKTQTTTRRPPQRQSVTNLRLVLIGGFGISVLGILYLMLRPKEELVFSEQNKVLTPQEKDDENPVKQRKLRERESSKKDEPRKMVKPEREHEATRFEMNSF